MACELTQGAREAFEHEKKWPRRPVALKWSFRSREIGPVAARSRVFASCYSPSSSRSRARLVSYRF